MWTQISQLLRQQSDLHVHWLSLPQVLEFYKNLLPCLMLRGLFNSIQKFRENNSKWKRWKFWRKWFIEKANVGHRNLQDHEKAFISTPSLLFPKSLGRYSFQCNLYRMTSIKWFCYASNYVNWSVFQNKQLSSAFLQEQPSLFTCVTKFKLHGAKQYVCHKLAQQIENASCFEFSTCFFLQQVNPQLK